MHRMIQTFIALVVAMVVTTGAFAQDAYRIKSGDALQIEVLEDSTLTRRVLVLPDGSISFPLVGSVQAAGRSVDAFRSSLTAALASNFNSPPTVFVSIASLAPSSGSFVSAAQTIDVYVMGEVNAPGKISVAPGTTILQILAEAKGLTRFAAAKRIELRRTDRASGEVRRYIYNYKGAGGGHSISGSTVLGSGDVIVIPQRRLFE